MFVLDEPIELPTQFKFTRISVTSSLVQSRNGDDQMQDKEGRTTIHKMCTF